MGETELRVVPITASKVPDPRRGPNFASQLAIPCELVRTTPPGALHAMVGWSRGFGVLSLILRETLGIGKPDGDTTRTCTAPGKVPPSGPVNVAACWGARMYRYGFCTVVM